MPSDSVAGDATNAAADAAKKQAKKMIWKTIILPNLPFILIGLIILFIIGVIALAIIGYVNQGSAGVSAFQKPDPINRELVLANADDSNAKNQAVSLAADQLMGQLNDLGETLITTGDQANLKVLNALKEDLLSLATGYLNPTNTVAISAIQRKADALEASLGVNYKNSFTNIQDALDYLNRVILTSTSPKLVISGKDLYYIRTDQVDDRILRALNYLVTPTDQGGAGFRKIKVRRIKADYDTTNKRFSKEWEFASDEDRSISPHFDGQAMDIAGIDMVNRSLYKKGIIRKKRIKQAPVDIMVSYQSDVPGQSMPGSSVTSTGFSFGNLSGNQALIDLFSIIGENSGYDFSKYNLEGATLPEIAKTMGMVVLNEELGGLKIDSLDDNSSQEKFLENIGKDIISKQFNLPKEGLRGDSSDEVQTNIGREVVAARMKLAPLSLTGSTSGLLFNSVGKRKIEKSFGLRLGSLDYLSPTGDFTTFVGQVLIEQKLNLEGGTFSSNDLGQIKAKININGDNKFTSTFTDNPERVDTLLNLPSDPNTNHSNKSYTANLINGVISVDTYKKAVGSSLIKSVSTNFLAKPALDTPTFRYFLGDSCPRGSTDIGGTCLTTGSAKYSKKDAAWDMPYGSIDSVISGAYSAFYDIGIDEVAKRLVDDDTEREVMKQWFTNPDLKTQPLENIRFINSTILGQLYIKTLDQIRNPDQVTLATLYNLNSDLQAIYSSLKRFWITDTTKEELIAQKTQLEEQLKIAGGKMVTNEKDGSQTLQIGNEDEWLDIPPNPINSALGLPQDGITKIFQLDQGDEVFFMVGGAKIDTSDNLYNPNALYDSNAKITFLTRKSDETAAKITELEKAKADLEKKKADGELGLDAQITDLNGQIKAYNSSLVAWNDQIRMEESSKSEIGASLNSTKKTAKDADIKLGFSKFSDINHDLSTVFKSLGSQKLESALDLPQGSLTSIFDYTQTESTELKYLETQREKAYQSLQSLMDRKNKGETGLDDQIALQQRSVANWNKFIEQQKKADAGKATAHLQTNSTLIGKKQIEEILSLPAGSFGGDSINDLNDRLGGDQKLYSYFAPGVGFDKIKSQLPITDQNAYFFKSILKATDVKLDLFSDTTYDLLKGNITPNQYAEKAGLAAIRTRSVDTLGNRLGLSIGGYTLTGSDVTALLNGNYLAVLLKVGAESIDSNINLPIGTVEAMINNPSASCQVNDAATGLQQSCLENLLVANGEENIARYLGVYGNTTTTSNLSEKMGQASIEKVLNDLHSPPALANGWFDGADLIDISRRLALSSLDNTIPDDKVKINLLNKTNKTVEETITANGIITQYGRKVMAKFGLKEDAWIVYNANQIIFSENSTQYEIAKDIDDHLDIPVGTTADFINSKITASEYKKIAQKDYIGNKVLDWALDLLPDGKIKDFIKKKNLDYSEIKAFYNAATSDTYRTAIERILGIRLDYAEGQVDDDNIIGQVAIEQELGSSPIGWFDEIKVEELPKTKGLEGIVENIVFLKNIGTSSQYTSVYEPAKLLDAENTLLTKFGFDPNYYSLKTLSTADFYSDDTSPPNHNAYKIATTIDSHLHIGEGSTQSLFQGRLSVEDYKERARKAYINYAIGEVAYNELLPVEIKTKLAKYGLNGEDLVNALNDPQAVLNKVLMNIISPDDLYMIMGLQNIIGIKIPIKGAFPDNFAQKIVEERLGLLEGSFSPNTTIDKVMVANTPKKFAASFRITIDSSKSDSEISSFITNGVFKEGTAYWGDPANILRLQNIDMVLRLNLNDDETVSNPTQSLLQKKISISQYLELIRKNQFSQFDEDSFVQGFVSFLASSNSENGGKTSAYMQLAGTTLIALGDPKLLSNSGVQLALLESLKTAGVIDLDDSMGFSPGTMENLILHPDDALSILFAQGLRSVAEKNFFGDAEPYKNDLLILFQYYLPESISNPYYFTSVGLNDTVTTPKGSFTGLNPNSGGNCTLPSPSDYDSAKLPGDRQNFIAEHRTLCAYQIIDGVLHDVIMQATIINKTNPNGSVTKLANGVDVPPSDLWLLERGDMGVLTNIGLAYAINRIRAEQDSDGNNIKLIPDDFQISYLDIKRAINPSSSEKDYLKNVASTKYMVDWTTARTNGDDKPTINTCATYGPNLPDCGEKENPNYKPEYDMDLIEGETKARNEAVVNAKKEIEYRYMDAQMMSLAQINNMAPIPSGFTKVMLTGTDRERIDMLIAYGLTNLLLADNFNKIFGKTAPYLGELKNQLQDFIAKRDVGKLREYITNGSVFRDALFEYVDGFLSGEVKKLGLNIAVPEGTAKYLLLKSYNYLNPGHISDPVLGDPKTFEGHVMRDFTVALASQFLDKKLGLKPGTAQAMYSVYKAYRAVETAQGVYRSVNNAVAVGTISESQAASELAKAKADVGAAKGSVITLAVQLALFAFSDELVAADQSLNLPPGSLSSMISFGTSYAVYEAYYAGVGTGSSMMAAGVWIAAAFMVYTILFGFNKVEYQITCPGDYTFRSWCKESNSLYTQWAQINTRKLIYDMLKINDKTGKNNLIPTILGTYRKVDYNYFNGVAPEGTEGDIVSKYMGSLSMLRGVKGLYQSDYMADFVHIGY